MLVGSSAMPGIQNWGKIDALPLVISLVPGELVFLLDSASLAPRTVFGT